MYLQQKQLFYLISYTLISFNELQNIVYHNGFLLPISAPRHTLLNTYVTFFFNAETRHKTQDTNGLYTQQHTASKNGSELGAHILWLGLLKTLPCINASRRTHSLALILFPTTHRIPFLFLLY